MRILVEFLYFFWLHEPKIYSRAPVAREVFVGRPVPACSQNICARPAGRATGYRAARNGLRSTHLYHKSRLTTLRQGEE
jgi:hypothetical protein